MAKKSKSDEILAQQLGETSPKQNVTLAEAKAEAAAKDPNGDDGSRPATGATKTTTTNKKVKVDGDGNPVVTTPRPKIAPGSLPSQVLAAHIPDQPTLYDRSRLVVGDKADAAVAASTGDTINKLAKKVAEKAVNLLRHRDNPSSVQVYTQIGMDLLLKNGEMTSKGIVEEFSKKYKQGTARAQGNQLMQLFPALQVATRTDKGTMVLNKDSVIAQAYKAARN